MSDELRCAWPGCTRERAAGRPAGSGRQKEYCLQADPPEMGGGPVHNARNRWASLRSAASRTARDAAGSVADAQAAGAHSPVPDSADGSAGHQGTGTADGESAGPVRDELHFSATKKRASDLLERARRQHAAAAENLRAERELYQRLGEQLAALADPASLDLEIAAIASRAGASVAQAEEDAARARRAQLAAERERDDAVRLRAYADAAAEQLATDAEAAELALAERTAEFDLDRATFVARAREAEELADRFRTSAAEAQATAGAAEARAATEVIAAREQASAETAQARTRADEAIAGARREAEEAMAAVRREAAELVAAAHARADTVADQARRDAEAVRRETAAAIADANAAAERARAEAASAREAASDAQANGATASARAAAAAAEADHARDELAGLREDLRKLDAAREAEVSRLTVAHQAALDAERGRAVRAETELDALRKTAP
jgi:ParB family chromosome partitioning protein